MFVSAPFRPHRPPGEYAAWAFSDQAHVACGFGDPIMDGDRAAVEWLATITSAAGDAETLAGVSLLRFGADGRVVEQRDVWSAEVGMIDVPHWAR